MTDTFRVFVHGQPSPQGSKIGGRRKDGKFFTRPATRTERPWRHLMVNMMSEKWTGSPMEGGLELTLAFALLRPKSVSPKKRPHPSTRPDGDKLERAVMDALKLAGVIREDGQIVSCQWLKEFRAVPGVQIELRKLEPAPD